MIEAEIYWDSGASHQHVFTVKVKNLDRDKVIERFIGLFVLGYFNIIKLRVACL